MSKRKSDTPDLPPFFDKVGDDAPTVAETPRAKSSLPPASKDEAEERIIRTKDLIIPPPTRKLGSRGKGWIKDPFDARDIPAKAMFGARKFANPAAASLEQYVMDIKDQGNSSACVGFASARAIHTRLWSLGLHAEWPSEWAIYNIARSLDKLSKDEAIQDDGCQPRQAMKGLKEWGVVGESVWPFNEATVNDPIPFDVLEKASIAKLTQWARIDTDYAARVEDTCHALASGYPVILGVEVDNAFEDYTGGVLKAPVERLGGHMLCLVGYKTENGKKVFRGVNSWGTSWGDKGLFWASDEWLVDRDASDLYVLSVSANG